MIEKEVWKDVIGYEGLYQVSNLGNLKSFWNKTERILKQSVNGKGYVKVTLYKSDSKKQTTIHQLVAVAFLNHNPNGMRLVIDHINDNKTDNRLENLQVVTQRFNVSKTQDGYSSKYIGVYWSKTLNKWLSQIKINGKKKHLGVFNCELAAALAYQNKLKQILC
jgi:hypothetical protein